MSQLALAVSDSPRKLLLVGNPNVGKSLLFTRLTRRYATVSNYPGTTVEITRAVAPFGGERREVIDTPGANGLTPQSDDERVTRDMLVANRDADVIAVGDINDLHRTLALAIQIAEHDVAFTLCLNMSDDARHALALEPAAIAERLGVPVVATSALRNWNIDALQRAALHAKRSPIRVDYPLPIEQAIGELLLAFDVSRGEALSVLAGDDALGTDARIDDIRERAAEAMGTPLGYAISRARLDAVDALLGGTRQTVEHRHVSLRDKLGALAMHRIWGFPILFGVLYIAWLFVGKFGAGTCVDFLQTTVFGGYVNVWATKAIDFVSPPAFIRDLLVGEYGIITMALTYAIAIILPVVMTFFTFFGLLEDTGYLPRLAVMLDRTFRRMGLNGKAVLPMVLGLGCDTMATLTTRILDSRKAAAIVTLLLALGVPCSAQLGVIIAMLAPLGIGAAFIWGGITLATIFLVGWLAAKVIPGEAGDFILEIPPIRTPKLSNIAIKVAARTEWYLKEAVPLFVIGTVVLYVLNATHLLALLQRALSPLVVGGLGLPAEAANSFVIGFLRRDYGAAGLFAMQKAGHLTPNQVVIALTVITLFIPCVANFLVMLRERGMKMGLAMSGFIVVFSFGIGALMHAAFVLFGVSL